jgi:4-alpha-glucanotransferase
MTHTYHSFKTSASYEQALDHAARQWGIESDFWDTWGQRHVTTPEIEREILKALEAGADGQQGLDRALEQRYLEDWDRLLPPVFVAGASAWTKGFPLAVPAALAEAVAAIEIRWEGGGVERRKLTLAELATSGHAEVRGAHYLRKHVPLPAAAPLGYHDVSLSIRSADGQQRHASMRLILCPDRTYVPPTIRDGRRTAGLAIALYGLRSERNWGCGDFTDLEAVTDWAVDDLGVTFLGLNPLHAIPNRQPFNTSPYLPSTSFYRNPLYLDLERIPEFDSRRAQAWYGRPEVKAEIRAVRSSTLVEYERVWALKLHALKLSFATFLRGQRPREFEEYLEREGALLDRFALWCALDEWIHRRDPGIWIWPDWPEEYRDPESPAVAEFARKHWRLVLLYKWIQWHVDGQAARAQEHARERGLSIGLFHDLALATDSCGADLWGWRRFYVAGCRVGAPPDGFSPKGQDWSFPPPNSEHHRETAYRLFAESIRRNCRHGGALRIDHVMRFFRLYWIPASMDPAHGAYVRDRWSDLLHVLALESVRQKVMVVGEDLGTVTDEIRHRLDRFGLFGYRVPFFEKEGNGEFRRPQRYTEHALVSSSTHDLPTLAGFWIARDIEARRQAGLLDNDRYYGALTDRRYEKQKLLDALFAEGLLPDWVPRKAEQLPELTGELHNALVGWLARAASRLMVISFEDLLKETEQQNLPATTTEHPNWRRKVRFTVEQLRAGAARDYSCMLRNWLECTGRIAKKTGDTPG